MQIHRIHGQDLEEALRRARAEHGDGALVLSQETLPSGAVTLAVAEESTAYLRQRSLEEVEAAVDPGVRDVRERLERAGASRTLIESIARAVEHSGVRGAYALDAAARVLGRAFAVQGAPKRRAVTRIVALVGPSGAGKTNTLAKLARRLHADGRSVLCATLEGLGVGELEAKLRADAAVDRYEVAIQAIANTAAIDEELAVRSGLDALLLDTPGIPARDSAKLKELGAELGRLGRRAVCEIHLVLPATLSPAALELALCAYGVLKPTAVVVTKLDETPAPAQALEACRRAGLAFSFLCDGPDARVHLCRARPEHFADLFLRGRLAA
jgi:flagellar biosynthesis protein FlhF